MQFTTPTQFVVLGLMLFVGFMFGLASHPGGKKWKLRYREEQDDFASYRNDADAQMQIANKRIKELERDNAALVKTNDDLAAKQTVVTDGTVAETPTAVPVKETSVVEAEDVPPAKTSWLSWGNSDDLARIRGIDEDLKAKLGDVGVKSFGDIEKLSAEDEMALEERIGVPAGYIAREQWREQAALLQAGNEAAFKERFGDTA